MHPMRLVVLSLALTSPALANQGSVAPKAAPQSIGQLKAYRREINRLREERSRLVSSIILQHGKQEAARSLGTSFRPMEEADRVAYPGTDRSEGVPKSFREHILMYVERARNVGQGLDASRQWDAKKAKIRALVEFFELAAEAEAIHSDHPVPSGPL